MAANVLGIGRIPVEGQRPSWFKYTETCSLYNEVSSVFMTLDELEREYVPLRQQALAVRSYL